MDIFNTNPNWADKYTTEQLSNLLTEDFNKLDSGEWVPDRHSATAGLDVLILTLHSGITD